MLTGHVNRHGEPLVPISLILQARPATYPGVIDTGFNGYLSVPKRLVRRSRWQAIGTERFEIATGALVEQEIYLGDIVFDGVRGPCTPSPQTLRTS
jgi:predicted aspartyl protease